MPLLPSPPAPNLVLGTFIQTLGKNEDSLWEIKLECLNFLPFWDPGG